MALPKITLYEMAEAVGDVARGWRSFIDRWNLEHPGNPLPDDDTAAIRARTFETAHLTLGLMALDEAASRKFVASLMGSSDAKLLVAMLTHVKPVSAKVEGEAA